MHLFFLFDFCLVCDESGDNCYGREKFQLIPTFLFIHFIEFIHLIGVPLRMSISTKTSLFFILLISVILTVDYFFYKI